MQTRKSDCDTSTGKSPMDLSLWLTILLLALINRSARLMAAADGDINYGGDGSCWHYRIPISRCTIEYSSDIASDAVERRSSGA
jgi:hypothetical protein